jgi:hypothetical protein
MDKRKLKKSDLKFSKQRMWKYGIPYPGTKAVTTHRHRLIRLLLLPGTSSRKTHTG